MTGDDVVKVLDEWIDNYRVDWYSSYKSQYESNEIVCRLIELKRMLHEALDKEKKMSDLIKHKDASEGTIRKTLDEVINTAPYIDTDWTCDALHYLKEYQEKLSARMYIPDGYKRLIKD